MAKFRNYNRSVFAEPSKNLISEDNIAIKLSVFIDNLDLSCFYSKYRNDSVGRSAYPVNSLIKIIIYGFYDGVLSCRKLEKYCRQNIVFSFLCNDDPPDHTTISRFFRNFTLAIEKLFYQTLELADRLGLIKFDHISGDGVRLDSMGSRSMLFNLKNANRKLKSIKLNKLDGKKTNTTLEKKLKYSLPAIEKLSKSKGNPGKEHTSFLHLTEKDARLIKKKNNFISGYNAQALVDKANRLIIGCTVFKNSFDRNNGKPLLSKAIKIFGINKIRNANLTFDNGYEDEEFFKFAIKYKLNLFVPTNNPNQSNLKKRKPNISNEKFRYKKEQNNYICPDNHIIPFRRKIVTNGKAYALYEKTCTNCRYNKICINESTKRKRKRIYRPIPKEDNLVEIENLKNLKMKYRIDMFDKMLSKQSQVIYSNRVATVEPVFAQIEANRGFRRFRVWGIKKVISQWYLVCLSYNIFKIIKYS